VLSTERSAVNTGREARRAEQSANSAKRQASNTGQPVPVRNSVTIMERSVKRHKGAKCQSTERSVDRRGGSSEGSGAIRIRSQAGSEGSGAIRNRNGTPEYRVRSNPQAVQSSKC